MFRHAAPFSAFVLFLSLLTAAAACAQESYRAFTLLHKDGKLTEKSVRIDFLNEQLQVHHPWIDSLHVYRLDSVTYEEGIPELEELHGTPLDTRFKTQDGKILLQPYTPEYYAIFSAYHTLEAMRQYKKWFGELIDFSRKKRFRELELYLGDYFNCNPQQYVLNPRKKVSPTVIYHEVGHRAFCQLDDTLHIGNVFTMVHNGLMEYFTATMADYPVIGEGMLPEPLLRDASQTVHYPEDKYYFSDFIEDLKDSYDPSMNCEQAIRQLYKINVERAKRCTTRIEMTHQSGMLITHPLWRLREQAGASVADSLVVHAMKNMAATFNKRKEYMKTNIWEAEKQPQWYDLLYALYTSDRHLFQGIHQLMIQKIFGETGYRTNLVKMPE
jgi:hypothetical protein